jgi:hypothetical protein
MNLKETYIDSVVYDRVVKELAELQPCPFAGVVTADQVKLALGERLNIWPASIAPN